MKTAVVLTSLLAALALSAQASVITINSLTVEGATNAGGSNVTVKATIGIIDISIPSQVMLSVMSTNGLIGQLFQPEVLTFGAVVLGGSPKTLTPGICTWTNTSWNPYFTGEFTVTVTATELATGSQDVSATAVTVNRTIGGTMNSVKVAADVSATAYDANMVFTNIDLSRVAVHTIKIADTNVGAVSIGCNLMNNPTNVTITTNMNAEDQEKAYMDTGAYRTNGTPFRFNMTLHARPSNLMGFGEIKRLVWTPTVTTDPAGEGILETDVLSCQPWRSGDTNKYQAHVGCAPLFVADTNDAAVMEGMIMCTTAHYMDVSPDVSDVGIGLKVNGQSNTTSYLKAFIPDTLLATWGIPVDQATELLAGYVTHFNSNSVSEGDTTAVTTEFTRIVGGTNIVYAYNSGTNGDSGYLAELTFTFHSPVAAQIGVIANTVLAADFDKDGKADFVVVSPDGVWKIWLSGSEYASVSTVPLYVAGGTPVAADFDKDGKADFAMVSPDGVWTIWLSGSEYASVSTVPLYVAGGTPVAADFDKDGKADFAMVAPAGVWTIWLSGSEYASVSTVPLYVAGGTPVAADFDKDGKADFAMVSPAGVWTIWLSGSEYASVTTVPLCVADGVAVVAADFDKDGKADFAMVDANGAWTIWLSGSEYASVTTIPLLP